MALQVRVVVEVLRLPDRRERQPRALHRLGELVGPPLREALAQESEELRAQHDALVVRRIGRIGLEVGASRGHRRTPATGHR